MVGMLMGKEQVVQMGKGACPLAHIQEIRSLDPGKAMALFVVHPIHEQAYTHMLNQYAGIGDQGYFYILLHRFTSRDRRFFQEHAGLLFPFSYLVVAAKLSAAWYELRTNGPATTCLKPSSFPFCANMAKVSG